MVCTRFYQMFVAFSKYLNFHNLIYLDWAIVSQNEGKPVWGKAPWGKALWAWGKPLWGKPFWGKGCWNCPEVWPSKAARVITGIHIFKSFFLRSDLLDPKSKIKLRRKLWLGSTQRGTKMATEFWKLRLRASFQVIFWKQKNLTVRYTIFSKTITSEFVLSI